jgi:hypothetical protein
MILATLKALTWGTVAMAVISALLLANGGGMLRGERGDDTRSDRSISVPATGTTSVRDTGPAQGKATGTNPRQ